MQHFFDFADVDLVAGNVDEALLSAGNAQPPDGIESTDIAGAIIAIAKRVGRQLRAIVVSARRQCRTFHPDVALAARWEGLSIGTADFDRHVAQRLSERPECQPFLGLAIDGDRSRLR